MKKSKLSYFGKMTYEDLKIYIQETYDYLTPNVAWGYNNGYLDAIIDHTDDFKHQEITALVILNSEVKKEKLNDTISK